MSFSRQLLQQRQGPTALNRIVNSVSGDYVMNPNDDVVIETAAGHILSLPLFPSLGDVHTVISQGGANTLSGNGRTINGAASLGLLLADSAEVTYDGANWQAAVSNSSGNSTSRSSTGSTRTSTRKAKRSCAWAGLRLRTRSMGSRHRWRRRVGRGSCW